MTGWQGGVRGVAFITSALLPADRAITSWPGLASQTDFYSTMLGLAGVPAATIVNASGPLPPDSVDLWQALRSGALPSPRSELVHNINGNYSGAIRVGRYKLLRGDPNESGRGRSDWTTPPESRAVVGGEGGGNEPEAPSEPACVLKPCLFDVLVS